MAMPCIAGAACVIKSARGRADGQITWEVIEGLEVNGFVTTADLANWIGCGRDKIIDAYDQIEAAGLELMRIRGIGGGAQFIGKRMRKAA